MAFLSTTAKQVHHDEYDHVSAARYFMAEWLPPAVGEPTALDTYSVYGASYLNEWDIVYPLAGKFAWLMAPLVDDLTMRLRLFNLVLFALLVCIAMFSSNAVVGYGVLLASAQLWYVFSYFNGDAFPLFVSFLIVALFATPGDWSLPDVRLMLKRYLLLGLCVGLLVLSKKTFWAFGLFTVALVAWLEFSHWRRDAPNAKPVASMGFFLIVIFMTVVPRVGYDMYINGSPAQKQAKIMEVAEALATPAFKPSTSVKASLNLRRKGVSLPELMKPPLHWASESFLTMFGGYNYNSVRAAERFYLVVYGVCAAFLTYLSALVVLRGTLLEKVVLVAAVATAVLIVCLSIYHSWTGDFQPQGRYLFGIFGLVAIVLNRNIKYLHGVVVQLFLVAAFLLSVHSFARDGLAGTPHFRDIVELAPIFQRPN